MTVVMWMATRSVQRSRAVEELKRVNRRGSLADLEMELRRSDLARLTGFGNGLAALDSVAPLHQDFTRMGIGGDITVGVPNQNQVAIALELISGIGDDAVLGCLHRRAFRHRQVDAVICLAVGLGGVAGDHLAPDRPA